MASDDEIARRFETGRIEAAIDRTRAAVDRQTRAMELLDRVDWRDQPYRPVGLQVLAALAALLLIPVGGFVWDMLGPPAAGPWRAIRQAVTGGGTALRWAGNIAAWLALLWLLTWPLRMVLRFVRRGRRRRP